MNEKLQYAEMLNIPVNTSTITYKPKKKGLFKKKKDVEKVKEELIEKVNNAEQPPEITEKAKEEALPEPAEEDEKTEVIHPNTVSIIRGKKKKKSKIKVNVIGIELVVIGVLIAVICLTSALVPTSGINVFFKEVFGGKSTAVSSEVKEYGDFSAGLPVGDSSVLSVDGGVMSINAESAVYSPVNGKVSALSYNEETKKYTVEITHNEKFKTVFTGLDYAYTELGNSVFSNIPVGYVKETATMCFYNGDAVITDYTIADNAVVWAV